MTLGKVPFAVSRHRALSKNRSRSRSSHESHHKILHFSVLIYALWVICNTKFDGDSCQEMPSWQADKSSSSSFEMRSLTVTLRADFWWPWVSVFAHCFGPMFEWVCLYWWDCAAPFSLAKHVPSAYFCASYAAWSLWFREWLFWRAYQSK